MNVDNPLAKIVTLKDIARRRDITENAITQAMPDLPQPAGRIGRMLVWTVDQWPAIDAAMDRRATRGPRRHVRVATPAFAASA